MEYGQSIEPGLSPTPNRFTTPKINFGASTVAPLMDGYTAGELTSELVCQCLQQLIGLEVAAVIGADRL